MEMEFEPTVIRQQSTDIGRWSAVKGVVCRLGGWLVVVWGLAAVASLLPVERMERYLVMVRTGGELHEEEVRRGRMHGVVAALVAEGREMVTYGAADPDGGGATHRTTALLDYMLLPMVPTRPGSPPVGGDLEGVGVLLGFGDHPEYFRPEFREAFPHRRRAFSVRLYSRDPLPEPCAEAMAVTGPCRFPWDGAWRGAAGGLALVASLWLPGAWLARRVGAAGGVAERSLAGWVFGLGLAALVFWLFGFGFGARLGWVVSGLAAFGVAGLFWDGWRIMRREYCRRCCWRRRAGCVWRRRRGAAGVRRRRGWCCCVWRVL